MSFCLIITKERTLKKLCLFIVSKNYYYFICKSFCVCRNEFIRGDKTMCLLLKIYFSFLKVKWKKICGRFSHGFWEPKYLRENILFLPIYWALIIKNSFHLIFTQWKDKINKSTKLQHILKFQTLKVDSTLAFIGTS